MTYISVNLSDIFSVENILRSRGFDVSKSGRNNDLILKGMILPNNTVGVRAVNPETELVFGIFHQLELRRQLLEFINGSVVPKKSDVKKLIELKEFNNSRQAFSTTFEWYVGELMVRDFSAMSSQFGITVRNLYRNSDDSGTAGDFDVITILRDLGVAYFECKTGGYNRKDIIKAIERSIALHCEFVIIILDSKIDKNSLIDEVKGALYPINELNQLDKVSIIHSNTCVYKWSNCFFISAIGNVKEQVETVLRLNSAKRMIDHLRRDWNTEIYKKMGYDSETLYKKTFAN